MDLTVTSLLEEGPIVDWARFKSLFVDFPSQTLLFRGHSDEHWELVPSFFRESEKASLRLEEYIRDAVPEALHQMAPYLGRKFDLSDFDDLCAALSILQNHGFPTPLLDWTYSPYIAAYFAFHGVNLIQPTSDFVRICYFNGWSWKGKGVLAASMLQPESFVQVVRPGAQFNSRLIPQQGVFTISNTGGIEDFVLARRSDKEAMLIGSVRVRVLEATTALRDLASMGINEHSLFPGLDGACRAMKARYFSPENVGESSPELMRRLFKDKQGNGPNGV